MSASLNKVELIGHIGNIETHYTQSGDPIVTCSVATSETWRDKATGQQQERTDWHRVVFFGGVAKVANQYLAKGSHIYIEGKLQTRKWQDQNGQDQYTTEIVLNSIQHKLLMLGKKPSAQ